MSSVSRNVVEKSSSERKTPTNVTSAQSSIWYSAQANALLILLAYRLLVALIVRTFFQPDEYYQSLEPAWWLAFGDRSGAWITWEWHNFLRSALHPTLFAVAYKAADLTTVVLHLPSSIRVDILLIAPKIVQAALAALGDYYTYKLAGQIYGKHSASARITLLITICSAWQWFCATRTFSNCAETTLTIIALYNWPFHWALGTDELGFQVGSDFLRLRQSDDGAGAEIIETTRLRKALLCAATAVILRPTNAIIWLVVISATYVRGVWHHGMAWEINILIRESLLCGGSVLTFSAVVDRVFYGVWVFPPWHFLRFNVFQSLAVFYGNNNWHYYVSQGYPLLLTIMIVPAIVGLYQSLAVRRYPEALSIQSRLILHRLGLISVALPLALSVLSHKEVRFIYPVLPALHILAAMPIARFLRLVSSSGEESKSAQKLRIGARKAAVVILVAINFAIALYATLVHNSGIINVTEYIRNEFEELYQDGQPLAGSNLTVAVFMPCHSIPWRSHLQYPANEAATGVSGWALTCEPPIDLNVTAKVAYLDEADIFYLDPLVWINRHMARDLPPAQTKKPGVYASEEISSRTVWKDTTKGRGVWLQEGEGGLQSALAQKKRAWPHYVVFFEHLQPVMERVLANSAYRECARFFNSHAHDDLRRKGDVVVWCVHEPKSFTLALRHS